MDTFPTPTIVVSRCLEFEACRYNAQRISDEFVRGLTAHVAFQPVCPEMAIGLGCPRDPIRVVSAAGEARLVQPATGRDVSGAMREFAEGFLGGLGPVDGFILKSRSPSCGIKDVKIYGGAAAETPQGKGEGFFGGAVLARFAEAAVEDEGRLRNFVLREHFLTKVFARAALRAVRERPDMDALVRFHTEHKWLLMAYNQAQMRALGRVVANHEKRPAAEAVEAYGRGLGRAMARPARPTSVINVLMHALGYVSKGLSAAEKALFLDILQKYRGGQAPLSVATALLRAWGLRFGEAYLLGQRFLSPYPEALVAITDSGKGRGSQAAGYSG